MSWNLNFEAEQASDAIDFVEADQLLPESIKAYICDGLKGLDPNVPVRVQSHGHLHTGQDHPETSATLVVTPITWRRKKT